MFTQVSHSLLFIIITLPVANDLRCSTPLTPAMKTLILEQRRAEEVILLQEQERRRRAYRIHCFRGGHR